MRSRKSLQRTLDQLTRWSLRPERLVSRLSLRIFAVNMLALLVLAGGLLYVSRYQQELIEGELNTLTRQAEIYASAVAEAARLTSTMREDAASPLIIRDDLSKQRTRRLVARLGSTTTNRIQVFDRRGVQLGDSDRVPRITTRSDRPKDADTGEEDASDSMLARTLERGMDRAIDLIPSTLRLDTYPQTKKGSAFPDVQQALSGEIGATAWKQKAKDKVSSDTVVLSAAVPIYHLQRLLGVVHVTRDGTNIASSLRQIKRDIITLFWVALAVTFILSLYLASSIASPLRRLARGADAVRQGIGTGIPDLTRRRDEIGDLSGTLRAMTRALSDRIDSISRFAADVAHELKNPLTSLRSAVETLPLVRTEEDRERLTGIILQDVKRLDRLISDISASSRLDADLAREPLGPVDLRALLHNVAQTYAPMEARLSGLPQQSVLLTLPPDDVPMPVYGMDSRLGQVFRNLIDNALSFSPTGHPVTITCEKLQNPPRWQVLVEDEGPGIPDAKLSAVFDRFYSERPEGEAFGKHSGLGLSIAKQIMDAHRGQIRAENRTDLSGAKIGARFIVTLNALG